MTNSKINTDIVAQAYFNKVNQNTF